MDAENGAGAGQRLEAERAALLARLQLAAHDPADRVAVDHTDVEEPAVAE